MGKRNSAFLRLGWLIVAAILLYSGVEHMVTQTLYGRVRIDNTPLLQGGVVVLLGLVEVLLGIALIWLHWRSRESR